jgi:uncharacterized protein YeaO (DUF488 family)
MSRHKSDDGVTPDPKITSDMFDVWYRKLAPPSKLVGSYLRKEISLDTYKKEYKDYLFKPEIITHVSLLTIMALSQDVTILCKEFDASECHRSVLADSCKAQRPYLRVEHR